MLVSQGVGGVGEWVGGEKGGGGVEGITDVARAILYLLKIITVPSTSKTEDDNHDHM